MHSTFETFGDGRVWFPLMNSVSSPGGGSVSRIVAFNRDSLGTATSPLAWTASNLGAWELYGSPLSGDLSDAIFGAGVFDRVHHFVYGLGGFSANTSLYWRVSTSGATLGQSASAKQGASFGHWNTWAVSAFDLGLIVAGDSLRQTITVLDVTKFGQSGAWTQVSNVSGTGFFGTLQYGGAGGAYVPANRSIGIGLPRDIGKRIFKLKIPTTSSGAYNPSGQWVWSTIDPSGPAISVPSGNSSANTKWNIIEDMGNGQSAIVYVSDISGPVYVYKVPAAGL